MRIHLLSDIHLEASDYTPSRHAIESADVIVLAGDIAVGTDALSWIEDYLEGKPVVYVCGNHERWCNAGSELPEKLKAAAPANVHVLENEAVVINGVAFLGATFWPDMNLNGRVPIDEINIAHTIGDYRHIRVHAEDRLLRTSDTRAWHEKTKQWLIKEADGIVGPLILVTHHAPSVESLPPMASKHESIDAAYASRAEGLVEAVGAKLWLHGHIHRACDYILHETRVVSNTRGYEDGQGKGFRPDLLIDVPC